jgi:hypothetical protein
MARAGEETWRCHVCGKERPDSKISVARYQRMDTVVPIRLNVRYCNDRVKCRNGTRDVARRWAAGNEVKAVP